MTIKPADLFRTHFPGGTYPLAHGVREKLYRAAQGIDGINTLLADSNVAGELGDEYHPMGSGCISQLHDAIKVLAETIVSELRLSESELRASAKEELTT